MNTPTLWNDTEELLTSWKYWQTTENHSRQTITQRLANIRAILREQNCTPRTLNGMHIANHCGQSHLSPNSRATYHASISAFCEWMVKARIRPDNPTQLLKRPKHVRKRPRPLTREQLQSIKRHAKTEQIRLMIQLGTLAGLRVHEVAKIHSRDIDIPRETITVTGKGGATWALPLHPLLVNIAEQQEKEDYWFPSPRNQGQPVSKGYVYKHIKAAMTAAGLPDATPHQLRHSYATELIDGGADIRTVQELMRHKDLNTTQVYLDVKWASKSNAIRRLTLAA